MTAQAEPAAESMIRAIHASPASGAFVVAGAGSQCVSWLLAVEGASATVLDAQIPYSAASLAEYARTRLGQHVSAEAAATMAEEAYWRALRLDAIAYPGAIGERRIFGVACTATIATNRPKRGEHRAHIALRRSGGMRAASLWLDKGARSRAEEEIVISRYLLNAIADGCGVEERVDAGLTESDRVEPLSTTGGSPFDAVVRGDAPVVFIGSDGSVLDAPPGASAVVCGSFNPVHTGHHELLRAAANATNLPGVMEISVLNVDKPPLSVQVLEARVAQLRRTVPVVVTRAPTFAEKARALSGSTFVIGYDTAVRVVEPRYYAGTVESALDEILACDCSFLVAGRLVDGRYRGLRDLVIPRGYEEMFTELPEGDFRFDGSSTALRAGGG